MRAWNMFSTKIACSFKICGWTFELFVCFLPMYVMSQFLGSSLACLTLKLLFNDQDDILPTLKSPTTDFEAIAWEFIITFILMFVICAVAADHRAVSHS